MTKRPSRSSNAIPIAEFSNAVRQRFSFPTSVRLHVGFNCRFQNPYLLSFRSSDLFATAAKAYHPTMVRDILRCQVSVGYVQWNAFAVGIHDRAKSDTLLRRNIAYQKL